MKLDAFLSLVRMEVIRATEKHRPMNSAHEAYAVILEELDELWYEITRDRGYAPAAFEEVTQIAAMCARYIIDLQGK